MQYNNIGQPIPSNINPHYLGVAIIILGILGMIPALFYWNKAQIRKDCAVAVYQSNEYPNYQPEQALVEACNRIGITFNP
jgi:hypothetical protein